MMRKLLIVIFLCFFGVTAIAAGEEDDKLFPGNLLSFSLMGNELLSKDFRISPKGYIALPEIGKINCLDQTISSLREMVIKKLAVYYKNASSLSLTKKNNDIFVKVMGLVKNPDYYLVSPDSSIQLALERAGGLSNGAQMNLIQLRHNGKITIIDYKKFLDTGDSSMFPPLAAMDELFVPSSSLLGNVKSGDMSGSGQGNAEKSWLDIKPGKAVRIMGGVNRPGRYEWSDEMNLLDILAQAGGPTKQGDTANIRIISNDQGNGKVTSTRFDLSRFAESGGDVSSIPVVKAGYTIEVPEISEPTGDNKLTWTRQDSKTTIYVFGEVQKPGRYSFNNKLNFLDILSAAEGPTEKADMRDIHLIDRQGIYPQVIHVNLALYFETGDPELIPKVLSGDAIYLPRKNNDLTEINSKHVIKILGEVAKPGSYRFTSDMTILDLLSAAGGPTSQAWVQKILIVNVGPKLETKSSVFDLLKFSRTGNMMMLPALREGDVVYVPNNQEDDKKRFGLVLQNIANVALIISSAGSITGNFSGGSRSNNR